MNEWIWDTGPLILYFNAIQWIALTSLLPLVFLIKGLNYLSLSKVVLGYDTLVHIKIQELEKSTDEFRTSIVEQELSGS